MSVRMSGSGGWEERRDERVVIVVVAAAVAVVVVAAAVAVVVVDVFTPYLSSSMRHRWSQILRTRSHAKPPMVAPRRVRTLHG